MRRRCVLKPAAALVAALCASVASGQVGSFILFDSIGDDASTFEHRELIGHRDLPYAGQGATYSRAERNQLQTWFWYRTQFDSREYALSFQGGDVVRPDSATLIYNEPVTGTAGRPLRFTLDYALSMVAPGQSTVTIGFTVENLSQRALTVDFFNFNDLDLMDTRFDDVGTLVGAAGATQAVTDQSGSSWSVTASTDRLVASVIDEAPSIALALSDESRTDFVTGGGLGLPGNYSGAFQWKLDLQPGEAFSGSVFQRLNVVPEPATLAGLALLIAVSFRKRHR